MLIDVARALRKFLSFSGFLVVFGKSHVVLAPRWYGAPSKNVLNLPLIADFGAKLLNRSMLPASRFDRAAAFVPFLMSTTYVGATFRPSAFEAHQPVRFFQTTDSDEAPTPDWYVYGPVPTMFLVFSRLPVAMSAGL